MSLEAKQEKFVTDLTSAARTHDEWLVIVRYGLATLLEDQSFLFELIYREAVREHERRKVKPDDPAIVAHQIFNELGLRFTVAGRDE